ncbi:MAG: ribose 5-phosphate isomerase B [Christensenellaceae bacterium]|jgi:ribose 5-phosphate isomerase B
MKIALGADHGGVDLKDSISAYLKENGHEVLDYGTFGHDSVDYPDFAEKAAKAVVAGEAERGIVVCTTGIGISIAANKIPGIRCALLSDVYSAKMTRDHNDANMIALGAGIVGKNLALAIVDTFLEVPFSESVNHVRRIEKIKEIEKNI